MQMTLVSSWGASQETLKAWAVCDGSSRGTEESKQCKTMFLKLILQLPLSELPMKLFKISILRLFPRPTDMCDYGSYLNKLLR